MPSPALSLRLRDLHEQCDRLLSWRMPRSAKIRWTVYLNELRFIRATLAWEEFIEQTFVCFLRGSPSISGTIYLLAVPVAPNCPAAHSVAIGSSNYYGNWLSERWTLSRASEIFLATSHPYIPLADPVLAEIRKIRNRIVHRSDFSRKDFHAVVTSLYGSLRPGMTPGRLLTEEVSGVPRIEIYLRILKIVANVIAK